MLKTNLEKNLHALQSLYPQQLEGILRPLPPDALSGLPIWIKGAVRVFALAHLGARPDPFLYLMQPDPELAFEQLMRIQRQLAERLKAPVLVIADKLPPKHRPLLVKFNIAFIYKDESVYAPELGLKFDHIRRFQEHRTIRVENKNAMLTPFALKLVAGLLTKQIPSEFTLKSLLKKIHQERGETSTTKTSTTLKELTEYGLLLAVGAGPTRSFTAAKVEKFWEHLLNLPLAPFFREAQTNHIPKNRKLFCLAGETALAQYSNLAATARATIAMSVKEFRANYEGKKTELPFGDSHTPHTIQIWKEPPHLFAINGVMNPIEVFFAMRGHPDERVQMALDEMIRSYGLERGEI